MFLIIFLPNVEAWHADYGVRSTPSGFTALPSPICSGSAIQFL